MGGLVARILAFYCYGPSLIMTWVILCELSLFYVLFSLMPCFFPWILNLFSSFINNQYCKPRVWSECGRWVITLVKNLQCPVVNPTGLCPERVVIIIISCVNYWTPEFANLSVLPFMYILVTSSLLRHYYILFILWLLSGLW